GRDGTVTSDDGNLNLGLSMPKELGGPGGTGTNPEQLFAAGYAACMGSALMLVARQREGTPGPGTITARGSLGKQGEGYGLAVALEGQMPDLSAEQAKELMEAAHHVCPYSNAIRGNVAVTLSVA